MIKKDIIIKLLQNDTWATATLYHLEKNELLPIEIINELIIRAIYEPDVSANGSFIKPCIKALGVFETRRRVLQYLLSGSDEEKMGAIKLFYWIREDAFIWNNESDSTSQLSIQTNNKANEEITNTLIQEYINCENPVLRFYYKWALQDEKKVSGLLKKEPETHNELFEIIKHDKKFIELFESLRKKKEKRIKESKYYLFELFLFYIFSDSIFYSKEVEINKTKVQNSFFHFYKEYNHDKAIITLDMITEEIEKIILKNDWQYLIELDVNVTKSVEDLKTITSSVLQLKNTFYQEFETTYRKEQAIKKDFLTKLKLLIKRKH